MVVELLMLVATVISGVIAGGAWAYTLEVHPAMLKAKPESSVDLFTPMFNHANVLQPTLGAVVLVCSLAIGFLSGNWLWTAGAVTMQLVGPYTIFGMMPTNRRLMDTEADPRSPAIAKDLKSWGNLHLVRTLINTAVFIFLCGLLIWTQANGFAADKQTKLFLLEKNPERIMDSYETFFNVITVPEGKEQETLDVWMKISDFMEKAEGCLSTKLHRNRKDPSTLINYAKFRSTEDFMALAKSDGFAALSQQLTDLGVERTAGVYDVLHSFGE